MKGLIRNISSLLEKGEDFALATVIGLKGSAPGGPGAKMVTNRDGGIFGTIGGGAMEAEVKRCSLEAIRDSQTRVLEFDLGSCRAPEGAMACGGQVEILIEYIDGRDKAYRDIYKDVMDSLNSGQLVWLITPLPGETAPRPARPCLLKANGEVTGGRPDKIHRLLEEVKGINCLTVLDDMQVIVEPVSDSGTAYVFGAGHIAFKLVPLLNMVGFKTVLIDDRIEYANEERFATADRIIVSDLSNIFGRLTTDDKSYIVIITRGHIHDQTVLAQALKSPAAYIGMVGSQAKRVAAYSDLLRNGYTLKDLKRIYSPIGLKIQAKNPEEIAISITAEMIAVRAKGLPRSHLCPS